MRGINGKILTFFTIVITSIAIYLNWSRFLMGYDATIFNFIISVLFLLLWLMLSFYMGVKGEEKYQRFIVSYWGTNIMVFILIWIISQSNFTASFLIPLAIWYGGPLYGFSYLFKLNSLIGILAIAPLGLIFSFAGYYIGLRLLKPKFKSKNI